MSGFGIIKGTAAKRPKPSAATLDKFYVTTDVAGEVLIGIMDSRIGYAWYPITGGTIYAEDVEYDGSLWVTPVFNVSDALDWLYANISGGASSLAATLAVGNTTGLYDIILSDNGSTTLSQKIKDAYTGASSFNFGKTGLVSYAKIVGESYVSMVAGIGGVTVDSGAGTLFNSTGNFAAVINSSYNFLLATTGVAGWDGSDFELGLDSSINGKISFYNASNSNKVFIRSGATAASYTLVLPTSDSTGTQALVSNGSGVLSWASMAAGTVTSVGVSSTDLSVSGSPITTSGSITLNVNTNAITYAKFQQVAALSVVGNGTNATADASDLTGTANQVLRVNGAGTSLGFGQLNLSSSAARSGTLPATNGGTGINALTTGDLIQATATNTFSVLASVSAGSYLRSGGVTTASVWSTLKLPNTATSTYIPYATSANTIGESGNLLYDGTQFITPKISGSAASGQNLTLVSTTHATKGKILIGTLSAYDEVKDKLGIGITSPTAYIHVVKTLSSSNLTGGNFNCTSSGSTGGTQQGLNINLNAGYTGSQSTNGFGAFNLAAGTASGYTAATYSFRSNGNYGGYAFASATTAGNNMGLTGIADNGNVNFGVWGAATTAKNSATNIGIAGWGLNTGSSPIQIAGYFGLQNSAPTFASAALMCDNGSTTSDIFVARDNGTSKWSIVDGGNTTWADAVNMVFNATTGTKIGTATTQKIGLWNATPIVQPTTAVAAATFVANTSAIADDTATFDGYTIGQVVKALRNIGLLA